MSGAVDKTLARLYGEAEELIVEITAPEDQVPAEGDVISIGVSFGEYGFVAKALVATVYPDSRRKNVYELTLQKVSGV